MARFASEAERLRHHRLCFNLAQELNCTPNEAEAELRKRAARADWATRERRLSALQRQPLRTRHSPVPTTSSPAGKPWMLQD